MDELVTRIYEAAKPHKPCGLFRGTESFEQLMDLFTSVQGIEFVVNHNFLDKGILRAISERSVGKWGIYIDKGRKRLKNKRFVVLVGACEFDLEYDTVEYPCKVVLLNGAKAWIDAKGFSVVKVEKQKDTDCFVSVSQKDNAIVRW